jgi:excisionase family DNA binding protein
MPARTATNEVVIPNVVGDGFVEVPEAATFLSLSRASVYKLMDQGSLVYAKFGRSRRIPRRALMEYAHQQLVRR